MSIRGMFIMPMRWVFVVSSDIVLCLSLYVCSWC
jgi:hypothetical protein